jgi:hypothetical protein
MTSQVGDNELTPREWHGSEITAERQENAAEAAAIDAYFMDLWASHLREICLLPTRDDPGEAGLQEACRRAFREGYRAGQRAHGTEGPAASDAVPGRAQ